MKIALIGAPGAGKSTIARFMASYLHLKHIECDVYFWEGIDLRERVSEEIKSDRWIVDGHISKISDIVFPEADKFVIIDNLRLKSLFRTIKRDWKTPARAWYNIQYYDKMGRRREELIKELKDTRKADILYLDNFPDLTESKLAAFCEDLKTAALKAKKPTIKR